MVFNWKKFLKNNKREEENKVNVDETIRNAKEQIIEKLDEIDAILKQMENLSTEEQKVFYKSLNEHVDLLNQYLRKLRELLRLLVVGEDQNRNQKMKLDNFLKLLNGLGNFHHFGTMPIALHKRKIIEFNDTIRRFK